MQRLRIVSKHLAPTLIVFVLVWLPQPVEAAVALGAEFASSDRNLDMFDSDPGIASSFSFASEVKQGMVQFKFSQEETDLLNADASFERNEFSLLLLGNQTVSRQSYIGMAGGPFVATYKLEDEQELGVVGLLLGVTGTKYVGGDTFFITGQLWGRFGVGEASDNFNSDGEPGEALGIEGVVGSGFALGAEGDLAILAGYRYREFAIEEMGFFTDDSAGQAFVALRVFISSR